MKIIKLLSLMLALGLLFVSYADSRNIKNNKTYIEVLAVDDNSFFEEINWEKKSEDGDYLSVIDDESCTSNSCSITRF